MITPIFERLHPIDIDNLICKRITHHTLFRAMQHTLKNVGWVPVPSWSESNVIPTHMDDLAETLNDLLRYAEDYRKLHSEP